jgi:DNA primase
VSRRSISQQFLNQLKEKINIVDVISESVLLKKSGSNYMGLCPFHGERSPSFSVSENKQLYHCFGCQAGGDVIGFSQELHGLSFVEAVEDLADRAGLEVPVEMGGKDPKARERSAAANKKQKSAAKLNRFVAQYLRNRLSNDTEAKAYLKSRAMDDVVGRNFYVGYAPSGWDNLTRHLATAKAPMPLAEELGLLRASKRSSGPGYFDLFRDRIIFPIADIRGRIRAFGGRRLHEFDPTVGKDGQKPPKYLNSPESFFYQKSQTLFGLYQAQKHIREEGRVVICEGFFDAVALHQAGISYAVATCGTALTPEHLRLLERFKAEVVLLFDGDTAGQDAAEKAMELGLRTGRTVRAVTLPGGQDPDDFVKQGREAIESLIQEAPVALDARIGALAGASMNDPQAKADHLRQIGRWLGMMQDEVGKELRIDSVAKAFGVSDKAVRSALSSEVGAQGGRRGASPSPVKTSSPAPVSAPARASAGHGQGAAPIHRHEAMLLAALLKWSELSELWVATRANLPPRASISHLFHHQSLRKLTAKLLEEPDLFAAVVEKPELCLEEVEDPQVRSMIAELAVGDRWPSHEQMALAMNRQVVSLWARISQQLKRQLALAEASQDASIQEKLLKDYLDVQRKIKEFNTLYGSQKEGSESV